MDDRDKNSFAKYPALFEDEPEDVLRDMALISPVKHRLSDQPNASSYWWRREDTPEWLAGWRKKVRIEVRADQIAAVVRGHEPTTATMNTAADEFFATWNRICDTLPTLDDERLLYESLLERAYQDYQLARAEMMKNQNRAVVEKKAGIRRGHAQARGNSWLVEFDKHPEWMARRPNGKGWEVSANQILAMLPNNVVEPHRTTIDRYRNKNLKEG